MKPNKVFLSESELQFILVNVVQQLEEFGVSVSLFGSRVKGTHSKFSDVDILIKSNDYSPALIRKVSAIEEFLISSNFPYKVDIVFERDIAESYRDDILQNLIELKW